MLDLNGKTAVITGGNSGIGAETARLFSQQGAAVTLVARRQAQLEELAQAIRSHGGQVLVLPGDVTQAGFADHVCEKTVETFGHLDILVNNAGVADQNRAAVRTSDALWEKCVAVDETAVFRFCRAALRHMTRQGWGSIVNVSSIGGVYSIAGAAYSSSKHAVVSLSKNIAIQYTGTGIRCNTICPGPTTTPMTEVKPENAAEDGLPNDPRFDREFTHICQRHADGSIGFLTPEDQANAILFFASDEAKAITGQWLLVDKGFY